MSNYAHVGDLIDENIVKFGFHCAELDVNTINAYKTMLSIERDNLMGLVQTISSSRFGNLAMTEAEYSTFISQIVSLSVVLGRIDDKLNVLAHYNEVLTPSCFKKQKDLTLN